MRSSPRTPAPCDDSSQRPFDRAEWLAYLDGNEELAGRLRVCSLMTAQDCCGDPDCPRRR